MYYIIYAWKDNAHVSIIIIIIILRLKHYNDAVKRLMLLFAPVNRSRSSPRRGSEKSLEFLTFSHVSRVKRSRRLRARARQMQSRSEYRYLEGEASIKERKQ